MSATDDTPPPWTDAPSCGVCGSGMTVSLHDTTTTAEHGSADRGPDSSRCAEGCCTACGTVDRHTPAQCSARRPRCHVYGCGLPTCIQAVHHGEPPTCLDHYFNKSRVETAERLADDERRRADYWRDRAQHWQTECGILVDERRYYRGEVA